MQTHARLARQLLVFLLAFYASVCAAWSPEMGEIPKPIENYEYVDGKPIVLGQLVGKPTVLYFGGDWCPPCTVTRPSVLKAAKFYGDKINVVFVSSDDNNLRAAKMAEAQNAVYQIAMPLLANPSAGASAKRRSDMGAFGKIYVWPTMVILNAKGEVAVKLERGGSIRSDITNELDKLLK